MTICNGRVQFKSVSFGWPASDSRLRIRQGGYGSPDGDRLPLVYRVGYDLLHWEVAGLSRRLLADYMVKRLGSSERLTKTKSHHTVGEIRHWRIRLEGRIRTVNLGGIKNTEDLLSLTFITVKGTRIGPGSVSRLGNRLSAMALLAKRRGQKNKSAMCTRPFYRVLNGTVTSLRWPYDVTSDVPNTSLSVPGNVGKRLYRSRGRVRARNGGPTVTKTRGLSNRTGAERSYTGVPWHSPLD